MDAEEEMYIKCIEALCTTEGSNRVIDLNKVKWFLKHKMTRTGDDNLDFMIKGGAHGNY